MLLLAYPKSRARARLAFAARFGEKGQMRFRLQPTTDGSLTVFDAEAGECFKSRHAARLEAEHVFYQPGVRENPWRGKARPLRVLELGFGLGTNFLHLAAKEEALELVSVERDLSGLRFFLEHEKHPALAAIAEHLRFTSPNLSARLVLGDFFETLRALAREGERFHAVFFDPFSPKANPEAWTLELFQLCIALMEPAARLVTYSVSRTAKGAALAAGLQIAKRDLPPSLQKRSALLAWKPAGS
jgi:tRNA U34 5-methylaminomethyl-2-thiouridine-forming methyltransferase MnmC